MRAISPAALALMMAVSFAKRSRLLAVSSLITLCLTSVDASSLVVGRDAHHVSPDKRALPAGWSSQGCWTDAINARVLTANNMNSASNTPESCIAFCSSNGAPYAGVEYGNECYCGQSLASTSTKAPNSDCNMPCAGSSSQVCGAGNRLNVYHLDSDIVKVDPAHNAGPKDWGFLGCYVENADNRTLPTAVDTDGGSANLTVALCTQACQKQGFAYAGVERGSDCLCGNTLSDSLLAVDGFSSCNATCNGNLTEYCGGQNRLDVFGYGKPSTIAPKWSSQGCYTDNPGSRTLRYAMAVLGGGNNLTVENCQNACLNAKYKIAGMEYAQECFCDNQISSGGGPAPDGNANCNMACKGNSKQSCGGPNRLNVYTFNTGTSTTTTITTTIKTTTTAPPVVTTSPAATTNAPSATTTASTYTTISAQTTSQASTLTTVNTTPTTSSTTTTTTTTISTNALQTGWSYAGCYVDNKYGRILTQQTDTSTQTLQTCINTCISKGFKIAGLQYSAQCFCGNQMVNGGAKASSDSECAMTCSGNKAQVCGGPSRMSVYSVGNFTSYNRPTAFNTTLPGKWEYQGCLTDTPQPRVLPYETNMGSNLTISNCLNLCDKFGYSAAAVEYGQQCFCGDDTDRINRGVQYRADTDCNTPCPSQPEALCGGAGAMNYYTWDNRNTWIQATGNAAGLYEFLIGGLIIPLISQMGINEKVVFVSKRENGIANSTGSWELDVTKISDFKAAWREVKGIRSDVFCSASLMLPDKGGRILNIGGWANDALYGVRLYWPDGSAGVKGVRGWEEDVSQVRLQTGRWYPTALQLVNGSILVVGGENGSNGKPVPNLEVLPKPPGGRLLYMEWLERTDPHNLYPFLTILPSGGIAAFYWNEARIIDEATFDTVRNLPAIPAMVNRPDGGRTYPLEGTMVLWPQAAPYTDPLTVMLCGGSTPSQGFALDNCVTLQPEVPNANWTIERMPSKRVMTCMAALPDGTFIIMNGAYQGQAGFGLADFANNEAVLYDPTKPLYSRFTRLANTTIDRMYHSEAVLMQDGRIIISGSNPEDKGKHKEEFRVEVFTPPYLMGDRAKTRPTYTIANTDWAFGGSYDITITSGDVGRITMMASTASTHGNSMGMRTIFPTYSCNGNTCTITAPPHAHITGGPGWHMLFVLNSAGTPSYAQWIRIGGDPAGLGNWPQVDGFTLPGV